MNAARIHTFAFEGGSISQGEVHARLTDGIPTIAISGLPEDAGRGAGKRVRALCNAFGLALPLKRLTIGLEIRGELHDARQFDLAIVLAVFGAMELVPRDELLGFATYGSLSASGSLRAFDPWPAKPIESVSLDLGLICPKTSEQDARAAGFREVLATDDLVAVISHFRGTQVIGAAARIAPHNPDPDPDPQPALLAPRARGGVKSWLPEWLFGRPEQAMSHGRAPILAGGFADSVAGRAPGRAVKTAPIDIQAQDVAPGSPPFASTGPHGHRARMREKVITRGTDALADYELLEMLLFLAFKQGDTKPTAKAVINRFGSFAKVLSASERELLETPGLGRHAVSAIKIVQASAVRLARAELMDKPILNSWDRLMAYLNMVMAREPVEQFRILFLDNRNYLLADELQARGTVNHTPVYPREVVKRALELHATALILVHNHPSGNPKPSDQDIEMTQDIRQAASALAIVIHDHVIVGNGTWYSFRREKLL